MATPKDTASDDNLDVASDKERRSQEVDIEKDGLQDDLERQASEPPYSVFSKGMKTWIIFLVSISALISPFGASMFLPALNVLSDVLDITPTQVNISITTYMVCLRISSSYSTRQGTLLLPRRPPTTQLPLTLYTQSMILTTTDYYRSHKLLLPLSLGLYRTTAGEG